jgi:hypothetical protein
MLKGLLVLAPVALVAGAVEAKSVVGIDQVPPGSKCTQSAILNGFVGQPASIELAARMMTAARAPKLRWIAAGQAATMDFSAHRLTVQLDAQSRVVSMTCG